MFICSSSYNIFFSKFGIIIVENHNFVICCKSLTTILIYRSVPGEMTKSQSPQSLRAEKISVKYFTLFIYGVGLTLLMLKV